MHLLLSHSPLLIFQLLCCLTQEGHAKSPNILLILADDVGTGEVPGYWNTGLVSMPNIQEQLVEKGTVFTDAHSTPLCAPSRYTLLSGNYPHRGNRQAGTWKINYQNGQFRDGQQSIADVLRANGYQTAMMGKWHIGGKAPTKEWFDPGKKFYIASDTILLDDQFDWTQPLEEGPQDIGFESSLISTGGIQEAPYTFFRDGKAEDLLNTTFWESGTYSMPEGSSIIPRDGDGASNWDSTAYNMILVNETARFLDDHLENRAEDPFFAYVALGSVHIPHSPPTSYLDGSPIAGEYASGHMDVLGEMDKVVGSLVQQLEDRNLLNDTIIVFTSDNGGLGAKYSSQYGHNSHGPLRGIKGTIYEGGHRIPLIMRWDNGPIPNGETRSHIIGLNDIFATLCQFAGVPVPDKQGIDSVGFADYIQNVEATHNLRKYLGVWRFKHGYLNGESIRKDNLKLIRKYANGQMTKMNLYDLETDIGETIDLIDDNSYNQDVEDMLIAIREISPCYDSKEIFNVTDNNGFLHEKTCEWFRDAKWRCNRYTEGHLECRFTCGLNSKAVCPIIQPSASPSNHPSRSPTSSSAEPSRSHSNEPSGILTMNPSHAASDPPSFVPNSSASPSNHPSSSPISSSTEPSTSHSNEPSVMLTTNPSQAASDSPSFTSTSPSNHPSSSPTSFSAEPSTKHSNEPSGMLTMNPSHVASHFPSSTQSLQPTSDPSDTVTLSPSLQPTNDSVAVPSYQPTSDVTAITFSPSFEHTSSPSNSSTGSHSMNPSFPRLPQSVCNNSILRFRISWNKKWITRGCDWVFNKMTTARCNINGVKAHCSEVCDSCSFCTDSTLRFKLELDGKLITRSCEWVKNRSTNQRCAIDGVAESCRKTCGVCSES